MNPAATPTITCAGREWTACSITAFKDAYGTAVATKQPVFEFDGHEYRTAGSRRLINFVEETFAKESSSS